MSNSDPDNDNARRVAPAATRNRDAILAVLARVLPKSGIVLEIASGTGQHAVHFAQALPGLIWQPSDADEASRASIDAWRKHVAVADPIVSPIANLKAPVALDVRISPWPVPDVLDGIVCINMIHIAPWDAAVALFDGAKQHLSPDGVLYLYGPYKREGEHTAPSNEAFDAQLRATDPAWGVRNLEDVVALAHRNGFALAEIVPMPANNLSLVFRRSAG